MESIDGQESMPLVIHHKAPVEHLVKLTSSDLVTWGNVSSEEHKKYDALTVLYALFAKERFDIDIPSTSSLEMIK